MSIFHRRGTEGFSDGVTASYPVTKTLGVSAVKT